MSSLVKNSTQASLIFIARTLEFNEREGHVVEKADSGVDRPLKENLEVLVVEDNEFNQKLIKKMLTLDKCQVRTLNVTIVS